MKRMKTCNIWSTIFNSLILLNLVYANDMGIFMCQTHTESIKVEVVWIEEWLVAACHCSLTVLIDGHNIMIFLCIIHILDAS